MHERAYEYAELGYASENENLCPGPDKYGSLWLLIQPHVHKLSQECKEPLQRDSAQNTRILEKMVAAHTFGAVTL